MLNDFLIDVLRIVAAIFILVTVATGIKESYAKLNHLDEVLSEK